MKKQFTTLVLAALAATAASADTIDLTVSQSTLDKTSESGQYYFHDYVRRTQTGFGLGYTKQIDPVVSVVSGVELNTVGFTAPSRYRYSSTTANYTASAAGISVRLQTPAPEGVFVFGQAGLKYHFCDAACNDGLSPVIGAGIGIKDFRISVSRSSVEMPYVKDSFWYTTVRAGFSIPF